MVLWDPGKMLIFGQVNLLLNLIFFGGLIRFWLGRRLILYQLFLGHVTRHSLGIPVLTSVDSCSALSLQVGKKSPYSVQIFGNFTRKTKRPIVYCGRAHYSRYIRRHVFIDSLHRLDIDKKTKLRLPRQIWTNKHRYVRLGLGCLYYIRRKLVSLCWCLSLALTDVTCYSIVENILIYHLGKRRVEVCALSARWGSFVGTWKGRWFFAYHHCPSSPQAHRRQHISGSNWTLKGYQR